VTFPPRDIYWRRTPPGSGRYRPWLRDRGSLTRRIQRRYAALRVEVIFQGLRRPDRDEQFLFAGRGRSKVLVREVYLVCGDKPVVFAHSVLDPRHLRGAWRAVAGLGSCALGAAVFADPRVERHPLRHRKVERHHELHAKARRGLKSPPGPLWARRSLFILHKSPILVTEVFLPGILEL
jgi:chorismate--pyruvate lyase